MKTYPSPSIDVPATTRKTWQTDAAEVLLERPYQPMDPAHLLVEIVVPVLNEEKVLKESITTIDTYCKTHLPYRYHITIADNGSTDNTPVIASQLAQTVPTVSIVTLRQRGRGRALKQTWGQSKADILAYMDVDLSTSLDDFFPMIEPLVAGHAAVGFGSRLHKLSRTTRGLKRQFISRCYNLLIKWSVKTSYSDAQCGFKAIRADVARELLPNIADNEWFFDTELLTKAERAGHVLHEQPVEWIEDTDSRVHIIKTARDDIRGLVRVRRELDDRYWLERLALPLLLIATGGLYLFGAMHNGMANSYYSAAVQAASTSWKAWFFGSLDGANFITVDKPPLATMVMGLSARIFGFSSFSMLLPSVLAGVGSVWLIYASVKRQFGRTSGLIAGCALAVTPVAALMFGFNNPDALLTLLLTASGYAFLRSLEQKRPFLWLGLAGLFTGLAFNTKMLQGMLVLPAMVCVYLAFAKLPLIKRVAHLAYAAAVTTISTFWWSVVVWLTPASSRPYIGSTDDNNIWSLIFGYNGFGRFFGSGSGQGGAPSGGVPGRMSAGSSVTIQQMPAMQGGQAGGPTGGMGGGSGPGGTGFGGETGIFRMFNSDFGPNIGWWLVLALGGGALVLWLMRRLPRTDRGRAAVVFWLLWLVIHMIVFSMTSGVIHPYYVVAMAPAVAALLGIGVPFLWAAYRRREAEAWVLPTVVLASTIVAIVMLNYASSGAWLAWIVGTAGFAGTLGLAYHIIQPSHTVRNTAIAAAAFALLLGPVMTTYATVSVAHHGSIPTAGSSGMAMQGTNNEDAEAEGALVTYLLAHRDGATWIAAGASANETAALQLSANAPVMAVGGFNGSDAALTLSEFKALVQSGKVRYYIVSGTASRGSGNSDIQTWVTKNGTKVAYGGSSVTLYKLSV